MMRTVLISCIVLINGGLAQCSWNQEPLRLAQVRQCFDDGGAYNETRAQQEVNIVRHAMDHYSYLDLVRNSGPPWDYRLDTTAVLQNLSETASVPGAYAQDWSFYEALSTPLRAMGDSHVAVLKPSCYAIIGAQPVSPAPFYLDRQNPNQVRYFLTEFKLGYLDLARTYDPGAVAFLPAREVSRSVLQLYEVLAVDGLAPAEYIASIISDPAITSPYSHDPSVSFTAALRNLQASLRLLQLDSLPASRYVTYTLRRCEAPMSGTDVDSADLTQLACAYNLASNEVTLRADWLFFHTAARRPTTAAQFARLCERQSARPEVRTGSSCRASAVPRSSDDGRREPGWLARASMFTSEGARGALLRKSILEDARSSHQGRFLGEHPRQGQYEEEEGGVEMVPKVSGYRSALKHMLGSIERRHAREEPSTGGRRARAGAQGTKEEGSIFALNALRALDDSEPVWATGTGTGAVAGGVPSGAALEQLREADFSRALQESGTGGSGATSRSDLADVSTVRRLYAADSSDEQSIFEVVRTVFNTHHTQELREVEERRQALIADPNVTAVPTKELLLTARNYTYTSILLKIPSFSPSVFTSCFAGVDVTCGTDVALSELDTCLSNAAATFLRRGAAGAYQFARARNASQIIVDVTGNDGGVVLLGRMTAAALSAQVTNVPSLAEYANEMRPGSVVSAMARFVDQQNGVGSARRLASMLGLEEVPGAGRQQQQRQYGHARSHMDKRKDRNDIDAIHSRRLQQTVTARHFPSFPLWGLLDPVDTAVSATSPDASIAVDDVDGGHGWFYASDETRRWGGGRHSVTKAVKLFDLTAEMAELPADVFPRSPGELIAPIPIIIASDGMCGSTCAYFLRSIVDTGLGTVLGLVASAGTAYPVSVTDSFAGGFIVQDSDSQLVLPYMEARELGMADPATFADGTPFEPPAFMPSSANVAYNFGSARSKRRPTYPLYFDPQRADAYAVDQSLNIAQPPSDLQFAAYLASEAGRRLPYTSNPLVAAATLVEAGTRNELLAQAVDTQALDSVVEDEVQRRANATLLVLLAAVGDTVSRRDYNILLYVCIALAVVAVIALLLALLLICCLGGGEEEKDVQVSQSTTLTRKGSKRTVTVRRRTIRNLKSESSLQLDPNSGEAGSSAEHRKNSLHTRSFRVVTAKGKNKRSGAGSSEESSAKGKNRLRTKGKGTSSYGSEASDVGEFDEEIDLGDNAMSKNRLKGRDKGKGERGAALDLELEPEKEGNSSGDGLASVGVSPSERGMQREMSIVREEEEEEDETEDEGSMNRYASSGMVDGQFSFQNALEKQEERRSRRDSKESGSADSRDYEGRDKVSHDVERHIFRHRYEDDRAQGSAHSRAQTYGGSHVVHAWGTNGGPTSGGSQYRSMRHAVGSFRYGYGRPRANSPPKAIAATTKPRWESQDGSDGVTDDRSVATSVAAGEASAATSAAPETHGYTSASHGYSASAGSSTSLRANKPTAHAHARSQRGMVRGRSSKHGFHDPLADPDHERSPAPLKQRPSQLDVRGRQAPLRVAVSFQEQSQMAERLERENELQRQAMGEALVFSQGGDQKAAEAGVYAGQSRPATTTAAGGAESPASNGSRGPGPQSPSTPRVRVTISELMTAGKEDGGGGGDYDSGKGGGAAAST